MQNVIQDIICLSNWTGKFQYDQSKGLQNMLKLRRNSIADYEKVFTIL